MVVMPTGDRYAGPPVAPEQNVDRDCSPPVRSTSEDWSALLDFSDQYLLKKGGTKKFDVIPPADQTP